MNMLSMTILYISHVVLEIHMLQPLPMLLVVFVLLLFIGVLVANHYILRRVRQHMAQSNFTNAMMQQALKISGNNVIVYDLNHHHISKMAGHMLPDEGVSEEVWKQHVHPDDLPEALNWLHQMMEGKLSTAEFNYRWNFDYSGGKPRWGYLHNTSVAEMQPGSRRPVSIISTLVDETQMRQQQEEEQELTAKYKLIFEQSVIGLSFYTPDGWLIGSNKMMREICHFDNDEGDAYFSNINLFESSPFRECVDKDHVEELWICSQSIVPERNIHDYLEIRLHPIRDDQGQLVYIAIAVRNVSEERNMYLQAILNDNQIRRANEEIQHYETELRYMMESCEMQPFRISFDDNRIYYYNGLSSIADSCTLEEMKQQFVNQDDDYVKRLANPREYFVEPTTWIGQVHPVFTKSGPDVWIQVNSIPEYDEHGQHKGCFGIWRNVSKLMIKQEQLRNEIERANDSGHQKSVFLANMTHEIRTPLNAIVGFSDLLQAIDQPEEKREMIRIIHNNCDMLLRLINDILVLSNMDANAMQIMPEHVDFAREFDDICQSLQQRVQEPGVEFQKDNPLDTLPVDIDYRRIQQVITNFVTNAVKYTHQGHIRVGYRLEERQGRRGIYLYCEDTGSGIPKDQHKAIFERFVKLNDFIQGTGLGLSICKAIIEKCGGEIGVESEVGQGSTFWFWIPV